MNKLKFTKHWDKLGDPGFTTIRSWTQEKEDYYRNLVGSEFQVWKAEDWYPFRNEYVLFHAWLSAISVVNPASVPRETLLKDVSVDGVPDGEWVHKILKMDKALLLTFSKSGASQKRLEALE